jgi:hypothetical protein
MPHEPDLLDTTDVYHCWLVWKQAEDGGRPYLVAVDTTEARAKQHEQAVKYEARFVYKLDKRELRSLVQVEHSFLNHAYGETMGQGYDRMKALAQEVRRATLDELEKANKLLAQKETEIKALQTELETLKASIRQQEPERTVYDFKWIGYM